MSSLETLYNGARRALRPRVAWLIAVALPVLPILVAACNNGNGGPGY